MVGNTKEVNYWANCENCKYSKKPHDEDPCNDCLNHPYNIDSDKPVRYEERKEW